MAAGKAGTHLRRVGFLLRSLLKVERLFIIFSVSFLEKKISDKSYAFLSPKDRFFQRKRQKGEEKRFKLMRVKKQDR